MSHNQFYFEGLDQLREDLRNLPATLTGEAGHLVEASTNAAEHDIKVQYEAHRVTGDLAAKVSSSIETSEFAVVGTVKSASKLAWIFENGTAARHTALGAFRGSMPPGHVFVPTVEQERRRLYEGLKDVLVRNGLEVSGD